MSVAKKLEAPSLKGRVPCSTGAPWRRRQPRSMPQVRTFRGEDINVKDSFDAGLLRSVGIFVWCPGLSGFARACQLSGGTRSHSGQGLLWTWLSPRPLRRLRAEWRALRLCGAAGLRRTAGLCSTTRLRGTAGLCGATGGGAARMSLRLLLLCSLRPLRADPVTDAIRPLRIVIEPQQQRPRS
jgi:hypothetical protein